MSDVQLMLYQISSQHGEKKCCLSINVFKSCLLLPWIWTCKSFFFFLTFWNRHLLKEESSSGGAAPQSCFFRKNVIFNHQQWLWVCVSVLRLERQKPVWQKYYQLLIQSLAKSFAFLSERRDLTRNLFIKQASNIRNTQLLQNLSGWQWLSCSLNVLHIVQSYNIMCLKQSHFSSCLYSINKAIVAITFMLYFTNNEIKINTQKKGMG